MTSYSCSLYFTKTLNFLNWCSVVQVTRWLAKTFIRAGRIHPSIKIKSWAAQWHLGHHHSADMTVVPEMTLSSVAVATLSCVRTCHDMYTTRTLHNGMYLRLHFHCCTRYDYIWVRVQYGLGSMNELFEGSVQGLSSWSLTLHGGYPILVQSIQNIVKVSMGTEGWRWPWHYFSQSKKHGQSSGS